MTKPFTKTFSCIPSSLVWILGLALLVSAFISSPVLANPTVQDVRIGVHPDKTRLVFDLSEPVKYQYFLLADPYRVVIDLPQVDWDLKAGSGQRSQGLVSAYRYGLFDESTFRIVVDLKSAANVIKAFRIPRNGDRPHRLVIDLKPTSHQAFIKRSRETLANRDPITPQRRDESASDRAQSKALERAIQRDKRIIVIDAGHGGVDPGAIGKSGTYEKHITLKAARELRDALKRQGYHVVMTRDRDIFLRLRQRINIARGSGADLFVSLHADSHPSSKVRGASVYTLSETASDKEAARLARAENKADLIAGIDLSQESTAISNILLDLAQRETMNMSAKFASMLVGGLSQQTRLLRNTHRFAGFVVLKSPDVPSVLVELGYLSNREDERLLNTKAHRQKLVTGIVQSINAFFDWREALQRS